MIWSVARQTQSSITLELPNGDDEYQDLSSQLTYSLTDSSITMILKVANNGVDEMRIAPGFHPYFAMSDDEGRVAIDDIAVDIQDLEGTLFYQSAAKQLMLQKRTLTMTSDVMTTWAAWSDRLGSYVCLEPTYAGYAFENDDEAPDAGQLLQPGESRAYTAMIQW
ncbi:MAG: aldose 1-epimerase [Chloroflexi bacterium]|nr:MAG: aldose 1-epimerase [Chloroflexota bacterium]